MKNSVETINGNTFKCCSLLKAYFETQNKNLAVVEFPSSITYGSLEWLIYVFYSCLLDYGMRSKIYHQNLINTYFKHPEIFNPKYVINNQNNEQLLLDTIKNNIHPRYPNIALKKWISVSNELAKYDNLLEIIKSYKYFNELSIFICCVLDLS